MCMVFLHFLVVKRIIKKSSTTTFFKHPSEAECETFILTKRKLGWKWSKQRWKEKFDGGNTKCLVPHKLYVCIFFDAVLIFSSCLDWWARANIEYLSSQFAAHVIACIGADRVNPTNRIYEPILKYQLPLCRCAFFWFRQHQFVCVTSFP